MILIQEAVERFNTAGRTYGVNVRPWPRRSKHQRKILQIEEHLSPLRLPMELRSFWNGWNPESVKWPCLDGLLSLDHVLERRERERPVSPAILLPVARWGESNIWIELASEIHPGGRVFRGGVHDTHVDLWAFGVSGLLDLLTTAFQQDLIDEQHGGYHQSHLEALATRQVREHVSRRSPRRIEAVDRSQQPDHWMAAEGLTREHFELRGATHTVDSFTEERAYHPQLRATLSGYFQNTICGGSIAGCVGTLTDDTGSLQVFVPLVADLTGAIGRDGDVEIDVFSLPTMSKEVDHSGIRHELRRVSSTRQQGLGREVVMRLSEQLRDLDTTIVVTGLRPIR